MTIVAIILVGVISMGCVHHHNRDKKISKALDEMSEVKVKSGTYR